MTDPTPGDAILVLGGYGAVGRAVSETLAALLPGHVIVAGRDGRKAADLAAALPGGAGARRIDVDRPGDWDEALAGVRVVVMAVERANAEVARACLERGVGYVDVSATTPVLAAIARLDGLAVDRGATAALSVGLAPGVTNLLARVVHDRLPTATAVDLTLGLGLAGDHGPDSRRWVVRNLAAPVGPATPNRGRGRARARVPLPGWGRRTAHPFPFADQDSLTAALGIPVTTRLCFDSRTITATVFALRAARVFGLLGRLGATGLVERALAPVRLGDDRFVVRAEATDGHGGRAAVAVQGRNECRATGVVAAHTAARLHGRTTPPGVRHLDELVDPTAFLDGVDGVSFTAAP